MGTTKKEFLNRNNVIIILNITAACFLLFCSCYFFFANMKMYWSDLKSWMFFSPIILLFGLGFVCFYIVNLTNCLMEEKQTHLADRYDLIYKIVFSITLVMLIIRMFLGDFMHVCPDSSLYPLEFKNHNCTASDLNVQPGMVIIAIISGIITWCTPKIRDNDNNEF